jgi:hypothetical protein
MEDFLPHHVERKSSSNFGPVILSVLAPPRLKQQKLKTTIAFLTTRNDQGNDDAILVRGCIHGCIGGLLEVMAAIANEV